MRLGIELKASESDRIRMSEGVVSFGLNWAADGPDRLGY